VDDFGGGAAGERLMRALGIRDVFPVAELAVEGGEVEG
jgi:hypothetical protein